jgi:iron complex outermembrane receptor protein
MKNYFKYTPIGLAVMAMSLNSNAEEIKYLPEVVITSTEMNSPLVIEADTKIPRQPLPAHDGADFLKTIPGFSVMRKGGTDGESVFRGMAGSRLNILVDDQNIAGGCSMRMDAPTAYIFPEIYDKLTVIKGPQTVQYANMGSAATIKFDREPKVYTKPAQSYFGSILGGSFGRHDEIIQAEIGNKAYYGEVRASNSQSGDYKDGGGNLVHSRYHRWSTNAAVGLTPDENTRLEFSAAASDGWAAYADRAMDGVKFARENYAFKGEKKNISPLIQSLNFQFSYTSIDHVMDQVTLRPLTFLMMPRSARVDHLTTQVKLSGKLKLSEDLTAVIGADFSDSTHSKDAAANNILVDDSTFQSIGLFSEFTKTLNASQTIISGLRINTWNVKDKRTSGITAGQNRSENTYNGFLRSENSLGARTVGYVGYGYAERFPDYWEIISMSSTAAGASAFQATKKEKTNQIDAGLIYKTDAMKLNGSIFYNRFDDFILVNYNNLGMAVNGVSTNINAETTGFELGGDYRIDNHWKVNSSVSYVYGRDLTNTQALAQLPPLEGRIGINYEHSKWTYGALTRLVAAQDRFSTGFGNIAGKDIGASEGFVIVSANVGYRSSKNSHIFAGVDNLFDTKYAEFISRAGGNGMGGTIPGYTQTMRVNEPGRTLWIKASLSFE